MTRVLRQSVVIDSRLLTIRLRSEENECRFIYILAEGGDVVDRRIVDIMLELAEA